MSLLENHFKESDLPEKARANKMSAVRRKSHFLDPTGCSLEVNKAKVAGGKATIQRGYSVRMFDPCEEVFNDILFRPMLFKSRTPFSIFSPSNQGTEVDPNVRLLLC